jgi:crotonobetainyl-CoA:carnitine CoA-transferase CaiB-like acyl-CoA transferase
MSFGSGNAEDASALGDIRVLELGSMLAGPFVGSLLGDFGAQVIKVEKPGKPDALREWPPHKQEVPLWWKTMARNKHAVTLDISRPEARDIAEKLIGGSDIVIENFRPGTLERWGLSPLTLREQFSTYHLGAGQWLGADGSQGALRAAMQPLPKPSPAFLPSPAIPKRDQWCPLSRWAITSPACFGAFGALAALHNRSRTGSGQIIDVALYEPILRIIESLVVRYDQTGRGKPLLGNQMEEDVPRNVYATADGGAIAISCGSQSIYEGLANAMQRNDLISDPRFRTMALRVEHRDLVDREVAAWMKTQTTQAALAKLQEFRVVAGKINSIEDVFAEPHIAARKAIETIIDKELGPIRMPAPTPKLSDTPGRIRWTGQNPGDANQQIFGNLLGMSSSEIDALRAQNIM